MYKTIPQHPAGTYNLSEPDDLLTGWRFLKAAKFFLVFPPNFVNTLYVLQQQNRHSYLYTRYIYRPILNISKQLSQIFQTLPYPLYIFVKFNLSAMVFSKVSHVFLVFPPSVVTSLFYICCRHFFLKIYFFYPYLTHSL